jgi:hypothetical protein
MECEKTVDLNRCIWRDIAAAKRFCNRPSRNGAPRKVTQMAMRLRKSGHRLQEEKFCRQLVVYTVAILINLIEQAIAESNKE